MAKTESTSPAAVALAGSDSFLQLEALAALMKKLPPDTQRIDFEGPTAQLADVLDELRSFAMFGGAKVVVVREAEEFVAKHRSALEDYLDSPCPTATLVLRVKSAPANQNLYKKIAKVGYVESCEPPRDLARWIIERAQKGHRLSIAPDAAHMLAEMVGDDLGRLDNELAKLALGADGGKITARHVQDAVAFQRQREIWDLTNALASGHTAEALVRWRQLVELDSSAEFRAVTWLGMWLEKVGKALDMLRRGENAFAIGQALKIWPRENQQPFIDTVKKMGPTGHARALDLLAQIDFQTKTSVGHADTNVERFILALAATKPK